MDLRRSNTWRDKAITAFGWSFDFFTVAVSITDVIADLLVAVQFYHNGHTLWAWLVFGAFINSSVVYSIILSQVIFDKHNKEFRIDGQHILSDDTRLFTNNFTRFLIVLPFSQLAPCGMYIFQVFVMPYWRSKLRASQPVLQRRRRHHEPTTAHDGSGGPTLAAVQQEDHLGAQSSSHPGHTSAVSGHLQSSALTSVHAGNTSVGNVTVSTSSNGSSAVIPHARPGAARPGGVPDTMPTRGKKVERSASSAFSECSTSSTADLGTLDQLQVGVPSSAHLAPPPAATTGLKKKTGTHKHGGNAAAK